MIFFSSVFNEGIADSGDSGGPWPPGDDQLVPYGEDTTTGIFVGVCAWVYGWCGTFLENPHKIKV